MRAVWPADEPAQENKLQEHVPLRGELAFQRNCGKLVSLKFLSSQILLRSRYSLAALAGLVFAAAFPNFNVAGLAWIGPTLMLASAYRTTGGESFRIGYVAGFAHFL